jgi:hypothetical protein
MRDQGLMSAILVHPGSLATVGLILNEGISLVHPDPSAKIPMLDPSRGRTGVIRRSKRTVGTSESLLALPFP